MKLARYGFAAMLAVAGCVDGTTLAGDDERDQVTPADAVDGERADADHGSDDGGDADGPHEVPAEADISRDVGDVAPGCGNGVLEFGEECDDGERNSDTRPDACRLACVAPACGDGIVDTGERCDDGNRTDGDGCPASCFPNDEAPATLEGDPVPTDDSFDAGGPPQLAWNGTGWGVAWGAWGLAHFAALDADARLLAPAVALPFGGFVADLGWHDGEYAVAFAAGWPVSESAIALLDSAGAVRAGPSWPPSAGEEADVAWAPSLDAWILAYVGTATSDYGGPILAVAVDHHAGMLGEPVEVSVAGSHRGPLVVATEAHMVAVWSDETGANFRGVTWPDMSDEPPAQHFTGPLPSSDSRLGGAAYRTRAIFGWPDGDHLDTVAIDGWTLEQLGEPAASGDTTFVDRRSSFVAVPARGYLGLCFCAGAGYTGGDGSDQDRVVLRLIRPDGTPMGTEIRVQDNMRNAGGCSVAWSGTEFVVVYWSCGGDGAWNTVYAQRVRPEI